MYLFFKKNNDLFVRVVLEGGWFFEFGVVVYILYCFLLNFLEFRYFDFIDRINVYEIKLMFKKVLI